MLRTLSVILLFCVFMNTECANILAVFTAPSISHQVVYRPITEELARRGHHITVVTSDPAFPKDKPFPNLTEIDTHDVSYSFKSDMFKISGNDQATEFEMIYDLNYRLFEAQIQVKEFKELLNDKTKQFDVILLEVCYPNALGVSHIFKAPVVWLVSFGSMEPNNFVVGSATHPVYYPTNFHTRTYNLNFWERIAAFYSQYKFYQTIEKYTDLNDAMLRKYLDPNTPSLRELANNVDLTMYNVHTIWENNRPAPPNVIYLGGLLQRSDSELPQDLKTYLDSSKRGVIYMSFGTNINPSLLPSKIVQIFVKVFSKLPQYDVLWKWDKDIIPGQSTNIKLGKWFPQSDLLQHPNVKLFITQGGLQSTDESILAGVPTIGIPMLADQRYNVDKYQQLGIGIGIVLDDITEDNFMNAIQTILKDDTYHKNVVNLREMMYDQPQTALERAIFWIEYVIKHKGARQLRAPTANLPWYIYYQIDIVIFLLAAITVTIGLVLLWLNYLLKLVFGGKSKRD